MRYRNRQKGRNNKCGIDNPAQLYSSLQFTKYFHRVWHTRKWIECGFRESYILLVDLEFTSKAAKSLIHKLQCYWLFKEDPYASFIYQASRENWLELNKTWKVKALINSEYSIEVKHQHQHHHHHHHHHHISLKLHKRL